MRSKNSLLSNTLLLVGVAAGLALAVLSIWADYEAVTYFFTGAPFDSFRGMSCPVLVTHSETVTISATLDNPSDREVTPFYRVQVSGLLGRSFDNQISLSPGQAKQVQWTVNADDIDLRYFIMTKIMVLPYAGLSTREAACGIFVLNLPGLTGQLVLIALLAISLLGMIGGLVWTEKQTQAIDKNVTHRVRWALVLVVVLAMLSGLAGWWLAGIVFGVLGILLLLTVLFGSLLP